MAVADIHVYQTQEVQDNHSGLRHEIAELVRDTLDRWDDVTRYVKVMARTPTAPSQEVEMSRDMTFCGSSYENMDLLQWWKEYAECDIDDLASDSNLLITNGSSGSSAGEAYIGGKFAVVECGPLVSSSWTYDGTYEDSGYYFHYAMNAVHEIGHNLGMVHKDGDVDYRNDSSILETPMLNNYADEYSGQTVNCNNYVPSDTDDTTYVQADYCNCAKNSSYL